MQKCIMSQGYLYKDSAVCGHVLLPSAATAAEVLMFANASVCEASAVAVDAAVHRAKGVLCSSTEEVQQLCGHIAGFAVSGKQNSN